MVYTTNVPQANQQISATQGPIEANFQFINTDLQVDHVFNGNNPPQPEGTHLQCQMANRADPGALPANLNGIYYVKGGVPKYYNGTASFIQLTPLIQQVITGTVNLNSGGPTAVVTVPAQSVGCYYIRAPGGTANRPVAAGQFVSTTVLQISGAFDPQMTLTASGTTISAQLSHAADNGVYTYLVIYYVP